jgi:hypothetical protein
VQVIIDGDLYVKNRRDAFKILIVGACVAYSAVALPFYERLGSPSLKAFPTPLALSFLACLFVFGMVSMAGIVRFNPRLEGIGMLGLSGIWACFAAMGISTSGGKALAFSSFLCAFSIAASWTWWQTIGEPWWTRRAECRARRGAA